MIEFKPGSDHVRFLVAVLLYQSTLSCDSLFFLEAAF